MSVISLPHSRYLCLWLPFLPTDRKPLPDRTRPFVLAGDLRNARVIMALNAAALNLGLQKGMTLADACARYPSLLISEADTAADARSLSQIADWCERYTPLVGMDALEGLVLDVTGCAHLFDGEEKLARDLQARLRRQGFQSRVGLADTVGCAWALAHHGQGRGSFFLASPGEEKHALAPLPLSALRLAPDMLAALADMGFRHVRDITDKPRAPMTARFGHMLMRRLDQAHGLEEEPISPRRPAPDFMVERRFAEPLLHEAHLLEAIAWLAAELGSRLEKHGMGTRRVEASLFHVDGIVKRIALGLSAPSHDAAQMARLFTDRLMVLGDESDPGFGFDMLRLGACGAEPIEKFQTGFGQRDHSKEVAQFLDRLGARFGEARLVRLKLRDTHIPERAAQACSAMRFTEDKHKAPSVRHTQSTASLPRPLRLLRHPELIEAMAEVPDGAPLRFRWRRVMHEVARVEGPERIAPEWWRQGGEAALTRDYFRVEDRQGLRLWLYRDGLYVRETARPRWFVHGIFV